MYKRKHGFNFRQRYLWSKLVTDSSPPGSQNGVRFISSNQFKWLGLVLVLYKSYIIEPTFTSSGFTNWVKATDNKDGFNKHEQSKFHYIAVNLSDESGIDEGHW